MKKKWVAPILAVLLFLFLGERNSFPSNLFNEIFFYLIALLASGLIVFFAINFNKWTWYLLLSLVPGVFLIAGVINLLQCIAITALLFSILEVINIIRR